MLMYGSTSVNANSEKAIRPVTIEKPTYERFLPFLSMINPITGDRIAPKKQKNDKYLLAVASETLYCIVKLALNHININKSLIH